VDNVFKDVSVGLIIVEKNKKYGFIDKEGNMIYDPVFQEIDPIYFHPYTAVLRDSRWGLIDSFGTMFVPMEYDSISPVIDSENFCKLYKGNKVSVFDLKNGIYKYRNLNTFDRIWAEHIVINIKEKYALFDLEFNRLIDGTHDKIELIDAGNGYYIRVINQSNKKYYNLDIEEVLNPIVN
jgi:hypothetical protein